ncbi:MAG: endonuclease Q family protein [Candidatus Anstonellaceae archaeon]
MQLICDLHLHTKYDIGCSKYMEIEQIAKFGKRKGIMLLSTGSFTHKTYLEKLKRIFKIQQEEDEFLFFDGVYFLPTTEVNNIFEEKNKKRRIHNLIIFSNLEECEQFNDRVEKNSYLGSDGRLCLKLNLQETLDIILSIKPNGLYIPAHIWTPWYGIFGSKSGFENLKEAFGKKENKIYALETGLSSDPLMNFRCSWLDKKTLVSFSDAHSPENIGREATIIEVKKPTFNEFFKAIKKKKIKTIEFFPQEGKYYASGCKKCAVLIKSKKIKNERCPICNKKITIGVLSRIDQVADRPVGYIPKNPQKFFYIVPLKKLISMVVGQNPKTKKIEEIYQKLIENSTELDVLLNQKIENIKKVDVRLADAILLMRKNKLKLSPGYDGVFGQVKI